MPDQSRKPKSRFAPQLMLADAAEYGLLIKVWCSLCRRTVYYLAADLLAVYGDQPVFDFRVECSRDKTAEFVYTTYRWPETGDYGNLPVRRPGRVVTTQLWHTVKLGDEVREA